MRKKQFNIFQLFNLHPNLHTCFHNLLIEKVMSEKGFDVFFKPAEILTLQLLYSSLNTNECMYVCCEHIKLIKFSRIKRKVAVFACVLKVMHV